MWYNIQNLNNNDQEKDMSEDNNEDRVSQVNKKPSIGEKVAGNLKAEAPKLIAQLITLGGVALLFYFAINRIIA